MIKQKHGEGHIEGPMPVLLAEYSCITRHLFKVIAKEESKEEAKRLVTTAFEQGLKDEDELSAEADKALDAIIGMLKEIKK